VGWIGTNTSGQHVILGPFPKTEEHGVVKLPVLGFAVKDGFAYVAETKDKLGASSISRFSLREERERTELVVEGFGIESLQVPSTTGTEDGGGA